MKKVQNWLLGSLCITCSMTCWTLWLPVGLRFYIFDIFALLFVGSAMVLLLTGQQNVGPDPVLRGFIGWAWAYLGVAALSSVVIFLNPLGSQAWELFAKTLSSMVVYTAVQTLVILVVSRLEPRKRDQIFGLYIGMIIFSCVFMFFEVTLASRGFDLIRFIFDPVTLAAPQLDEARTGYYQWDIFFRGNGFASTNTQASYIIPSIPVLLESLITRKRIRDYVILLIAVVGLLLTMSRGGLLGALVAVVVYFVLNWRRSFVLGFALIFLAIPIYYGYHRFEDEVGTLARTRDVIDGERINMYADGFTIFAKNLAGIGFGQYGVLFSESSGSFGRDANMHNNFLQVLVELSLPGIVSRLGLYAFVLWTLIRIGTEQSRAAAAGLTGLLFAGFFSNVLTTFQAIFCFAFLFVWGVGSRRSAQPNLLGPHSRPDRFWRSRAGGPQGGLSGAGRPVN